ncbi:MAG: hypothetical protein ACYCO5_10480 [Acidobacteriaceae bacterium]
MAKSDHRISADRGPVSYTCENWRYRTDTTAGFPHGRRRARGSVLSDPLLMDGQYSLWLEHVMNKENGDRDLFWLIWYKDGIPEITGSGVFHREDIKRLAQGLIEAL